MIRKRKHYPIGTIVLVNYMGQNMVGEVTGTGAAGDYFIYLGRIGWEVGLDHHQIYGTIENE